LSANLKSSSVNSSDEKPEDVAFNDGIKALIKNFAEAATGQ